MSSRRWSWTGIVAALCMTASAHLMAGELAIPPCYFAASGGFYVHGDAGHPCWSYAPAAGCTVGCYAQAWPRAVSSDAATSATASWYGAEMISYRGGAFCPACGPAPHVQPLAQEPEEVAPGPVFPGSEPR